MTDATFFPPWPRHFAAWVFACLASLALACAASAQETERREFYGDANIEVQLLAEDLPAPGREWTLALTFSPSAPEWHGYWKNPGDAGQGLRLTLDLPEGWEMGEALYPVPDRLLIGDLMNHIYEGEYAVLVPVSVPEDAEIEGIPTLTGYVEFLACTDRVCVPQDAVLEAGIGLGDFPKWRAQVAPLLDAQAAFDLAGDTLRLAIPLPESVTLAAPHVFIANEELVDYAAAQSFRRAGDTLTVDVPLGRGNAAPPGAVEGILAFGDESGVRFRAVPGEVPTGGEVIAGPATRAVPPLWTLAIGALVGGFILNIMPCVFPILSLKALSLARAGESEAAARVEGLAYTAGVVLACVALGAVLLALRAAGEQVGWAFQLQEPSVVIVLLVLAAAITANFAGVFELPSIDTGSGARKGAGGAFATGLLAAFAATPCTGPFMAAALGAALLLPAPLALVLFAMLGLGLALPFLALGFVPALRRRLPKPGAWMETFRRIMAIPMGLTAIALVWLTAQLGGRYFAMLALLTVFGVILALWVVGKLQRAGKMAWPALPLVAAPFLVFGAVALPASFERPLRGASASLLAAQEFSEEALAEGRASGKPVFVWFTADWCVTCKVNESVAIEREATAEAFEEAEVIAMVGDWTVRDEAITAFLTEQGAAGVPLYLWYEPGAEPEQLPQVLTPDTLPELARRPR
ncbi:MAG: thioredoxin family protein [Erythrobacter sp.]|uniref:protein-disulfide reductase DsbD family protein n=1 Tax=Erythrobacter sp. TaxID=1042 RepID=UPI002602BF57|nr:thioredoxin family protein [Erythrobacter sp.]MDJ0978724.1 thioredoxin family protein [Erythrobacter sp.]